MTSKKKQTPLFVIIPILLIGLFLLTTIRTKDDQSLVVYCSHDSIFSEEVFTQFTLETGIKIIPRYDTEASKSLGLTEKILREGKNSDCDVYWSNEMFSMAVLKNNNLLTPFKGTNWGRIPEKFKDDDGFWCGFAARMRVVIFNTENYKDLSKFHESFSEKDLSQVAIALPLYGTTLTHFAILQKKSSPESLQKTYEKWRQKGLQIVGGNGPARNLVANGNCRYGWTDTDDYFGAVDNNAPVAMLPYRLPNGKTIIIPNTVGILKSTKKLPAAKQFVNYLTSAQNELALARSKSRQIPLGPINETLPEEVNDLKKFVKDSYDLKQTFNERQKLIDWLKQTHRLK